jgi:hypothetical protein
MSRAEAAPNPKPHCPIANATAARVKIGFDPPRALKKSCRPNLGFLDSQEMDAESIDNPHATKDRIEGPAALKPRTVPLRMI